MAGGSCERVVRRGRRAGGFRAVEYPTPAGCAAAYFPEANVLVPLDHTAEVSNTPVSKSVIIRVDPAAAAAAAAAGPAATAGPPGA